MTHQRQHGGLTAGTSGQQRVVFSCMLMVISMGGCGEQEVSKSSARSERVIENSSSTVPVSLVSMTETSWTTRVPARDWDSIVIHHTATETGTVESIHQVHQQRIDAAGNPWRGIGYHFVIGNGQGMVDGEVESTFRWREQLEGAHAGVSRYNQQGVGICLVGNFDLHPPTEAQVASLRQLIAWLSREYEIPVQRVLGHGQLKATACPGKYFPLDELSPIEPPDKQNTRLTTTSHPQL